MSKYNDINTAKDLIREVSAYGLSTDQDDRNRAADIFGNSGVGELAELANSKDTISGKQISQTFYFIAFNIWHWEQATRFFNEHTNPATKDAQESERKLKAQIKANEELLADVIRGDERVAEITEKYATLNADHARATSSLEEAQREVLTLKAKLYDLMTVGAYQDDLHTTII